MSKYYTPEIEEFHVGFEYEANVYTVKKGSFWFKTKMDLTFDFYTGNTRVKYLDREDIESLGFVYDEKNLNYYRGDSKESFVIDVYKDNTLNVQHRKLGMLESEVTGIAIKNKSELKRLLKQLNIK